MTNYKTFIINSITLSRIVLVIPVFIFSNLYYLTFITLWVGLSDFLDGYLARKWIVASDFGSKLDQISDKIVLFLLLTYFHINEEISFYFFAALILRECLILIFRYNKFSNTYSNFIGKLKTFILYLFKYKAFNSKF